MGGGGLPTGGQGSKVYVLCAEPKEHKRFRPGTRPGGIGFPAGRIGDRGDRESVSVPNVYVSFPAPTLACSYFSLMWRGVGGWGSRTSPQSQKGSPKDAQDGCVELGCWPCFRAQFGPKLVTLPPMRIVGMKEAMEPQWRYDMKLQNLKAFQNHYKLLIFGFLIRILLL